MVHLVPREQELATIDALLDGTSGGVGALAVVAAPRVSDEAA